MSPPLWPSWSKYFPSQSIVCGFNRSYCNFKNICLLAFFFFFWSLQQRCQPLEGWDNVLFAIASPSACRVGVCVVVMLFLPSSICCSFFWHYHPDFPLGKTTPPLFLAHLVWAVEILAQASGSGVWAIRGPLPGNSDWLGWARDPQLNQWDKTWELLGIIQREVSSPEKSLPVFRAAFDFMGQRHQPPPLGRKKILGKKTLVCLLLILKTKEYCNSTSGGLWWFS